MFLQNVVHSWDSIATNIDMAEDDESSIWHKPQFGELSSRMIDFKTKEHRQDIHGTGGKEK